MDEELREDEEYDMRNNAPVFPSQGRPSPVRGWETPKMTRVEECFTNHVQTSPPGLKKPTNNLPDAPFASFSEDESSSAVSSGSSSSSCGSRHGSRMSPAESMKEKSVPVSRIVPPPPRGKEYTRPAWETANLVSPAPSLAFRTSDDEELDRIEGDIDKVKQEINELEKMINSKRSQRDELREHYASLIKASASQKSPAAPPSDSKDRFTVDLEKRGGLPLGLSVGYDESRGGFLVSEVKPEGVVPEWNQRNGTPKIKIGDLIMSVNGVTRNRNEMTKEFSSSRVVLVIEAFKSNTNAIPRPVRTVVCDISKYPSQSAEAYNEILDALKSSNEGGPRTGIMRFGDIPIRFPDRNGLFNCDVCRISGIRSDSEWIEHFKSNQHSINRATINSKDLWSKFSLDNTLMNHYWYEHKMGFWSVDDPGKNGTGSHTVSANLSSYN